MKDKNSIPIGLLVGAVVPIIGYIFFESIFDTLEYTSIIEEASGSSIVRRERTIILLAICCNLLPFNYCMKRRWNNTMRGVIFPTLLYVSGWLYKYYNILF